MAAGWADIRLVTLDLDDTLVATAATVPARVAHAARAVGDLLGTDFAPSEVEAFTRCALSCDPDLRLDVLSECFALPRGDRAQSVLRDAYGALLLDLLAPVSGACEAVAALSKRFRLTVITNGPDELQRAKLRRCGLGMLAETAIVSESFGVSKPDPAIFREACSRAGVEPRRALHVGDSPVNDVEGAIKAGMRAVLVRTPLRHAGSAVRPHASIGSVLELVTLLELTATGERGQTTALPSGG